MIALKFTVGLPGLPVTLDLELGEGVTGLAGHSGSGKTTTLNAIAGFERADGSIVAGNETWLDSSAGVFVPAHRRSVGYMFQNPCLFDHLDVAGNLRYPLRWSRNRKPTTTFESVVDALDLCNLLNHRTHALSGGEARRVALGRTLLRQPRLLLLDEPLSGMDADRKFEILPYIENVARSSGIPIILVSHQLEEITTIADELVLLHQGRVVAQGPVNAVLGSAGEHKGEVHDQHTVWTMNVAEYKPDQMLLELVGSEMKLFVPAVRHRQCGEEVRVRIRARDVAIATSKPRGLSIRNVIPATVASISGSPLSPHCQVNLETSGALLKSQITRASLHDLDISRGQGVYALVKSVALVGN